MEPKRAKHILGWYSPDCWINGRFRLHEIVLTPIAVSAGLVKAAGVLAHELVHLVNAVADVKDTSRQNRYHNRQFRDTAVAVGLLVPNSPDPTFGWSETTLGPELKAFVRETAKAEDLTVREFRYTRRVAPKAVPSLVKLACRCGNFVYVTRARVGLIRVWCNACESCMEPVIKNIRE
jgi:hypothetical protein